jgi:hypothetical protein
MMKDLIHNRWEKEAEGVIVAGNLLLSSNLEKEL